MHQNEVRDFCVLTLFKVVPGFNEQKGKIN